MDDNVTVLTDWMTTPVIKIGSKITEDNSDACWHSHAFYEIFYILEGNITHIVNDEETVLEVGNIVFLRLFDTHKFIRKANSSCKHRDIVVSVEQFERSCNYISPSMFEQIKNSPSAPTAMIPLNLLNELEQDFLKLTNISFKYLSQKPAFINIIMLKLLNILFKQNLAPAFDGFPSWFEELLSRFNMPIFFKGGLNKIIEPFKYDKSYMCRTFKKLMGTTMSQHLCLIRLQYAAILLNSTDKNICNIAYDIGFSSVSFFNTQFKKVFNSSPKMYRKYAKI